MAFSRVMPSEEVSEMALWVGALFDKPSVCPPLMERLDRLTTCTSPIFFREEFDNVLMVNISAGCGDNGPALGTSRKLKSRFRH